MLGRGLFRRLVVLVVLTLVTAVVVPGVMAPSASANGCGGFTFEVADIDELYDAISCYNGQSPEGDYTITLTSDIEIDDEYLEIEIDSGTNSGDLTIDGAGYRIFGDGYDEYLLDMDNDGTGTVYIKNITFTGADDDAIEWDGGNLDVRDSFFIDNDSDIYGGPDSGNGDLTLVNVVFSIGDDTQGSDSPVSIFWREPLQTLTVIICNSSFDAGGDPSIYVSTVPKGDGGEGLVDLYLANNVFNSDNDFELGDGVTVIDDESPETCQADEPTGSAAAVPYPGPFTQMPEPAGDAASPETPTAASAAGDGVAGLAYTGTTTTTLAYLAVGLIGFGALLVPAGRRRN